MMKILAVVSNIVLFTFTLLVLATDGAPTAPVYVTFTALLLVVPLLNVFVVSIGGLAETHRRLAEGELAAKTHPGALSLPSM